MNKLALFLSLAVCASAQQQRPNGLYATFHTSLGAFTAKLYEKETPRTVKVFVGLARGTQETLNAKGEKATVPYYNGITFHRIVPGAAIQSGDPTGTGKHDCGVTLRDEILPGLRFDTGGRLAIANTGEPDSGSCQFFVTVGPMSEWNEKYSIFGQVIEGMDVVNKINHVAVNGDRPVSQIALFTVTIQRVGPEPVIKEKAVKEKKKK